MEPIQRPERCVEVRNLTCARYSLKLYQASNLRLHVGNPERPQYQGPVQVQGGSNMRNNCIRFSAGLVHKKAESLTLGLTCPPASLSSQRNSPCLYRVALFRHQSCILFQPFFFFSFSSLPAMDQLLTFLAHRKARLPGTGCSTISFRPIPITTKLLHSSARRLAPTTSIHGPT